MTMQHAAGGAGPVEDRDRETEVEPKDPLTEDTHGRSTPTAEGDEVTPAIFNQLPGDLPDDGNEERRPVDR